MLQSWLIAWIWQYHLLVVVVRMTELFEVWMATKYHVSWISNPTTTQNVQTCFITDNTISLLPLPGPTQ